jgi:hypothetical protein
MSDETAGQRIAALMMMSGGVNLQDTSEILGAAPDDIREGIADMNQKTTGDLQDRDTQGRFQGGQSGNPAGRPRGSQNTATKLRQELLGPILPEAIEILREKVSQGEKWAVVLVVTYSLPKPKPVDPEELEEFERRLEELEQIAGSKS